MSSFSSQCCDIVNESPSACSVRHTFVLCIEVSAHSWIAIDVEFTNRPKQKLKVDVAIGDESFSHEFAKGDTVRIEPILYVHLLGEESLLTRLPGLVNFLSISISAFTRKIGSGNISCTPRPQVSSHR